MVVSNRGIVIIMTNPQNSLSNKESCVYTQKKRKKREEFSIKNCTFQKDSYSRSGNR